MSTRGGIARKNGTGFKGVYHHWDGYPSGLGKMLFELRSTWRFMGDTKKMVEFLIEAHPAGWSSISGLLQDKEGDDYKEEPCELNEKNASGRGVEYVYVFDGDKMEIWSSYCSPNSVKFAGHKMIGAFGVGDRDAVWKVVATVDLDGPEPDWEKLNQIASEPDKVE